MGAEIRGYTIAFPSKLRALCVKVWILEIRGQSFWACCLKTNPPIQLISWCRPTILQHWGNSLNIIDYTQLKLFDENKGPLNFDQSFAAYRNGVQRGFSCFGSHSIRSSHDKHLESGDNAEHKGSQRK